MNSTPTTPSLQSAQGGMDRRQLLLGASAALPLLGAGAGRALGQTAQPPSPKPDYNIEIARGKFEIAPGHEIETLAYNGTIPGPLIRVKEGQQTTIAITNRNTDADIVHWHGLAIPSEVDGSMEEGSPMIEPGKTVTETFVAKPAGTRWYHSHAFAGPDLTKSLYTAQFGFFYIEPANSSGSYDQEVFIAMHHWEPSFVSLQDTRPRVPADNGLEVAYKSASFNDKALGHGEPIRVRQGQRVLFHLLNASPTVEQLVSLPGHQFNVIANDGNPVPTPQTLQSLYLAPGERIDAIVEMNQPGVWIFGSNIDSDRELGMGIVVEYAGQSGTPAWEVPARLTGWDYGMFARPTDAAAPVPDARIELTIDKIPGGHGGYNRWTINGKSWPDTDPILIEQGKRYRFVLHNLSGDMHPIHTHRHTFEVTTYNRRKIAGLMKDVVALRGRQDCEIDLVADNPGPTLFHCHMQDHQDFGFMALIKYK